MSEKHKKIIYAAGIAVFLLLSVAVFWYVGRPLLQFVSEPEKFRLWVDSHGLLGPLAFLGMMVLQVFIAIIPGEPLEIGAGYAFGAVEGTLLCLLGAAIGSALVFLFVRRFGVKAVEVFFSREKIQSLKFLQNTRRIYAFTIVAFLLPGTPKDVLCYCAGLTTIRLGHFVLISTLCRIPSVVTSTLGGNALGSGEWGTAAGIFAVTLVISAIGLLIYKRICRMREEHHHGAD
ncbi:MAG TPA: TVP38/TMEM64 family protein [Candidatus Avoscillospira avicola]|uniref:TVP38/TMEM64 family membrane protein n=1 Tax=Candidatus Avoscillospira avicola TaxID=2840706 RepID=A0A9D1API8_9FIRM|nr:TVP38/TMEM64 family protein [Candidatus Avoscillospira avicola]